LPGLTLDQEGDLEEDCFPNEAESDSGLVVCVDREGPSLSSWR
jgi:hypothetical protein